MSVFEQFERFVNWRKFKNEKQNKRGASYNCGTKGHFAREYHKKKQNWNNKFKGSSQIATKCKK